MDAPLSWVGQRLAIRFYGSSGWFYVNTQPSDPLL